MKLYLWRDVLRDYSAGMAFAIAGNVNEARGMLAATGEFHNAGDLAKEPEEHSLDEPFCALVHGGG
jgi:hypothetical protein